MFKLAFAYHGGNKQETGKNHEEIMTDWQQWPDTKDEHHIDDGSPVGLTLTISANVS